MPQEKDNQVPKDNRKARNAEDENGAMVEIIGGRFDDTWGAPGTSATPDDVNTITGTIAPKGLDHSTKPDSPDLTGVPDVMGDPTHVTERSEGAQGKPGSNYGPALGATGAGVIQSEQGAGDILSDEGSDDQGAHASDRRRGNKNYPSGAGDRSEF